MSMPQADPVVDLLFVVRKAPDERDAYPIESDAATAVGVAAVR